MLAQMVRVAGMYAALQMLRWATTLATSGMMASTSFTLASDTGGRSTSKNCRRHQHAQPAAGQHCCTIEFFVKKCFSSALTWVPPRFRRYARVQ